MIKLPLFEYQLKVVDDTISNIIVYNIHLLNYKIHR